MLEAGGVWMVLHNGDRPSIEQAEFLEDRRVVQTQSPYTVDRHQRSETSWFEEVRIFGH